MENENNLLNFTSADVKKTPETIKAVVVSIDLVKASDVYGLDKIKNVAQQLIKVTMQNADHKIDHAEYLPYYEKDNVPDNSKLGKFLLNYEKLEVSMIITLKKNDDGFYKLDI